MLIWRLRRAIARLLNLIGRTSLWSRLHPQAIFRTGTTSRIDLLLERIHSCSFARFRQSKFLIASLMCSTKAKMEMNKFLEQNPIVQDKTKDGSDRYVGGHNASIASFKEAVDWTQYVRRLIIYVFNPTRFYALDIPWNYGFIPQTFEDPKRKDSRTGLVGALGMNKVLCCCRVCVYVICAFCWEISCFEKLKLFSGDNDPIDVVVITPTKMQTGSLDTVIILSLPLFVMF